MPSAASALGRAWQALPAEPTLGWGAPLPCPINGERPSWARRRCARLDEHASKEVNDEDKPRQDLSVLIAHLCAGSAESAEDLSALFATLHGCDLATAALPVLELMRAASGNAAHIQPEGPHQDWRKFIAQRLGRANALPEGLGRARSLLRAPEKWEAWNQLVRLAELHADQALAPRVLEFLGVLTNAAVRPMDGSDAQPLELNLLRRLVSFAQACDSTRGGETAAEWRRLASVEPVTADALKAFAGKAKVTELKRLARAVADVLESPKTGLPPRSHEVGPPRPFRPPAPPAPPQKPPRIGRKRGRPARPVRPPSAAGLLSAARHARAAMAVGVAEAWGTLPLDRLARCTSGLMKALDDDDTDQADFAVALLLGLFFDSNLAPTLKLSLRDNDDLFYCPVTGCIWLSRRALLLAAGRSDEVGWYYFLLPQRLVHAIAARLARYPDATVLAELMARLPDKLWLHQAQAFLLTFGDAAHPAYTARFVHSYGPALVATGAGDAMAAHLSGRLVLSADSGSHYYGAPHDAVRAQVTRTFAALGLGEPVPSPQHTPFGRPLLSDDEIRQRYGDASLRAATALSELAVAADVGIAAARFNQGMVGCWDGYVLVSPSRPHLPARVSVESCFSHRAWHYRWDKNTEARSDRLLPMTRELASVFATAWALREAFVERLLALGVTEGDLPRLLRDVKGTSPALLQAVPHPRRPGQWTVAALGAAEHGGPPEGYRSGDTDPRAFWLSAVMVSGVPWAERALGGHGRRAAHLGTAALSTPVLTLLDRARAVVEATMSRLQLPLFAGQQPDSWLLHAITLDLRFFDRRRPPGNRPSDLLEHYCDRYTVPALQCIEVCEDELGQAPRMNAAARVLLALIVGQGLVWTDDIRSAWAALHDLAIDVGPFELHWVRASGQPISMPLLAPVVIALVLFKEWRDPDHQEASEPGVRREWPTLEAAENELRLWLREQFPRVQWPSRPMAAIAALGFLAARVVRLVVPPFACKASRPDLMAATFDRISVDRLFGRSPSPELDMPAAAPRRRQRLVHPQGRIPELRLLLHRFSSRTRPEGGDERRALRIGRVILLKFGPNSFKPCEWLAWRWLTLEARRWAPPSARRDVPRTWYQYLCHIAGRLMLVPRDWNPEAFDVAGWRRFGEFMLDVSEFKQPERQAKALRWRRKALTRFVLLLSELPEYRFAQHALGGLPAPAQEDRYRATAASVLVMPADVDASVAQVRADFESLRHEGERRALLFQLSIDLCGRDGEALAIRPKDFSADRSWAAVREGPFSHVKNTQSLRFNGLAVTTQATATSVLAALQKVSPRQRYVYAQEGRSVSLRFGLQMQDDLWPLLAARAGNVRVRWYSLRGAGLMQRLAPGWETRLMAWLRGPMLAMHAQALLRLLEGSGPGHFTWAIGRSGHVSDPIPISTYLTFAPFVHAAAMCVRMQRVRVTPELAAALEGRSAGGLRKWVWDCCHTHRIAPEAWSWTIAPRFPGWSMKDERPPVQRSVARPVRHDNGPLEPLHRLTALRFVLLQLLGHEPELDRVRVPVHHRARCEALRRAVSSFEEVHTHRRRAAGIAVPMASALRLAQSDAGIDHLRRLVRVNRECLQALDRVLKVHEAGSQRRVRLALSAERVQLALRALPRTLGIELQLADGDLPEPQVEQLERLPRVCRWPQFRRARDPSGARLVAWPRAQRGNHHQPSMWTVITRLAVEILLSLETGKEVSP